MHAERHGFHSVRNWSSSSAEFLHETLNSFSSSIYFAVETAGVRISSKESFKESGKGVKRDLKRDSLKQHNERLQHAAADGADIYSNIVWKAKSRIEEEVW